MFENTFKATLAKGLVVLGLMDFIKNLPEVPGVYFMKDSLGNVMYIGKSNNLRKRVRQYFYKSKNHQPKILEMVNMISSIEYIETDTELDALLLECKLIKKLKPLYNSSMKNDQGYPYLKITLNEKFPQLKVVYEESTDGSILFGPYKNIYLIERTITYLHRRFPIKRCNLTSSSKTNSGCLNYHLGHCMGACKEEVEVTKYQECITEIIALLNGKNQQYVKELKNEMETAAINFDFEKAAKYRDELKALRYIIYSQRVVKNSARMKNILALELLESNTIKLFFIKGNKLFAEHIYKINTENLSTIKQELLEIILDNFSYLNHKKRKIEKHEIDESQIIESYLKNNQNGLVYLKIPNSWIKKPNLGKLGLGLDKMLKTLFRFAMLPEKST